MTATDFADRLAGAAVSAGIPLAREAAKRLARHYALMIRWNRRVNLTRITDPDEAIAKHYLDSLLVADLLRAGARVLDIGCGPGFPGIPIGVVRPDLDWVFSESSAKKRAFLSAAVRELGLSVVRVVGRTSEVAASGDHGIVVDAAVCRAMGTLARIVLAARPFLAPGAVVLAMKGPRAGEEIAESAESLAELRYAARIVRRVALPGSGAVRTVIELAPTTERPVPES